LTVKVELSVSVQPLALVTVTVYVPAAETVVAAVVLPFDQRYPVPPDPAKVTDPPWQKVVGPLGVMTAMGRALTVMAELSESVQPLAFVTVTV
jgi:hypothetical protein